MTRGEEETRRRHVRAAADGWALVKRKATPGPWETGFEPMFTAVRAVTSRRPIAECATPGNTWPQDRMNARLIAAAPDLLRAVHAALGYVVSRGDLREGTEASGLQMLLRAAIAKATADEQQAADAVARTGGRVTG